MFNSGLIWILLLVTIGIGIYAQVRVSSAFNKFSKVRTRTGKTGAEVAAEILATAGIHDVQVSRIESYLGDHYDPRKKRLCLSPGVYDSESVAAAGIAAHECGHAIQHAEHYMPLKARMTVVPVTMAASQLLPFIMIGGFMFGYGGPLLTLGIIVYSILTVFQLITLPVEFDASRRAKVVLTRRGMVTQAESEGVSTVLNAAALTYVAAFLTALFHLLHLLALRDRD